MNTKMGGRRTRSHIFVPLFFVLSLWLVCYLTTKCERARTRVHTIPSTSQCFGVALSP